MFSPFRKKLTQESPYLSPIGLDGKGYGQQSSKDDLEKVTAASRINIGKSFLGPRKPEENKPRRYSYHKATTEGPYLQCYDLQRTEMLG